MRWQRHICSLALSLSLSLPPSLILIRTHSAPLFFSHNSRTQKFWSHKHTQSDICKELKLSYMVKTTSPPTATAASNQTKKNTLAFIFWHVFPELTNFQIYMCSEQSHTILFYCNIRRFVESQNCWEILLVCLALNVMHTNRAFIPFQLWADFYSSIFFCSLSLRLLCIIFVILPAK